MLPFCRYETNNLTLNRVLGLKEQDSYNVNVITLCKLHQLCVWRACKREKEQGQRSAPFFYIRLTKNVLSWLISKSWKYNSWIGWPLTLKQKLEAKGIWDVKEGWRRCNSTEDRHQLSSLSKSRKKFGPCSSSVQVSNFNRFPIWRLQERKEKERGEKGMCVWSNSQKIKEVQWRRAEAESSEASSPGKSYWW